MEIQFVRNMSEEKAIVKSWTNFKCKPSEKNKKMVDAIRHSRMDQIVFERSNNELYLQVFVFIMESIKTDFPQLENEIVRQVEKKKRWMSRRNDCEFS